MENAFLDRVLIPLADQFEAGNRHHWYTFKPGEIADEGLRESLAEPYDKAFRDRSIT
jgi:hypothetical protein